MLQKLAKKNVTTKLAQIHPVTIFTYLTGLFLCIIFNKSKIAPSLFIILAMSFILILSEGIAKTIKSLAYGFFLTIIIMLLTVLTYHKGTHVFLYINDNPLTYEGIYTGIMSGIFIMSMLLFFKLFSLLISQGKFLFLFGRFFPTITLMINMIFAFSKGYKQSLQDVILAQQTLGISTSSTGIVKKIRNGVCIFSGFIGFMLENSLTTASSMKARGYNGRNYTYNPYRWKAKDKLLLCAALVFILLEIFIYSIYKPDINSSFNVVLIIYTFLPLANLFTRRNKHENSKC